MDKICGIYKITSPSGRIYIGQSVNILSRKSRYVNLHCETQSKIYRSIVKYGWDVHVFEIIHECEREELNELERYYIKLLDTFNSEHGLNLTSGGDSASREISDETREKMKKLLLGNKRTLNYKYSDERKKEICERIKIAKKDYVVSDETREKISKSRMGIKYSREIIEKAQKTKRSRIYECRGGSYEIYNQNDELAHKFCGDFRRTIKKLNLPYKSFNQSHILNRKIKRGNYIGWYAIKLHIDSI